MSDSGHCGDPAGYVIPRLSGALGVTRLMSSTRRFSLPPDWLSPAVPRVITIHDVIPLRYRDEYDPITLGTLESVLASLDPKRDFATTVSQYTKNDFCDLSGFPPERVVVAPLSAADDFRPVTAESVLAQVRDRYGLTDKPFLLSVSNPQPRKNIPLLIRSFYRVLRRLPSWCGNLVLVGNVKAGFGVKVILDEIARCRSFLIESFGLAVFLMNTFAVCIVAARRFFSLPPSRALDFPLSRR